MIKKCYLVVMLCKLEEECRVKCEQYWPKSVGETLMHEDIVITLDSEVIILTNSIIQRNLTVKYNEEERKIQQLQVICWPDHSIPEEEIGFKMTELIYSYIDEFSISGPTVVHCRYCIY